MGLKHLICVGAAVLACLSGCGGGGSSPAAPPVVSAPAPPPVAPDSFAQVDATANAAFTAQGITGMGVAIYDAQGVKRFEKMYGNFAPDMRVAIASSSKMISGLTILRIVDQGFLTLDSTTGAVLGWTGPQGTITLRQLLSFTSGLPADAPCTSQQLITLANCVDSISTMTLVAAPGTRFDYGSTHLHVAARMAEVVTGKSWAEIFATQLKAPLGLGADMLYYSAPRQSTGTLNPLIAGGVRATMNEYARVLQLEFNRGMSDGNRLIADALFTAQGTEPYPNAVIGSSPFQSIGLDFHYGLAAWLECPPPAANCGVVSSPGAFGFTPWVDREGGYYAMIAMEGDDSQTGIVKFSVDLAQQLKPMIREALLH
jgi:D-alanyl-D-alanine-carboxypeptidase/D-alanyl-D-alanine-endopeptidase